MKILFITGRYKPGKCGISDYVSILSTELESSGFSCRIKSIDPANGNSFSSLALNMPRCDLISLQFAPYSFSENGISGSNLKLLGQELKHRQVHVIFHEIWIGEYKGSGVVQKLKGWRQKKEIVGFIRDINPDQIYATNAASLYRLRKSGIPASYLYLFGNIPYVKNSLDISRDSKRLALVFFGTLYENFPFEQVIERLKGIAEQAGRKLKICVMGRQREKAGIQKLRKLTTRTGTDFEELGQISEEKASHYLQNADFGVSTTPFDALGKSGTAAAMLEHGLHVITFDDKDTPDIGKYVNGPIVDQVILLNDNKIEEKVLRVLENGKEKPYRGVLKAFSSMVKNFS
jgi:glycosyltransferase involved in cell wall biosynthesis